MTCIVGAMENGHVILGGDSVGSNGYNKSTRLDVKVFKRGPFVIGFTSSFRMGQVLRFNLETPEHPLTMTDYEYMVTRVVDAVRKVLKNAGYAKKENEVEEGGTFLIGYRGQLYSVESDYQVGMVAEPYHAVGSGEDFALGAMYSQPSDKPAKERILVALQAAATFSTSVGGPFNFVSTEDEDASS